MRWDEIDRKQIIYGVLVLVCFASVFGFIIFLNAYNNAPADYLPSPSPANLSDILMKKANGSPDPQIQGVATQSDPLGPSKPLISPSPVPLPSPTATSTPTPTPAVPSPSVNSSSPTPTPSPSPSPSTSTDPSPSPSPSASI